MSPCSQCADRGLIIVWYHESEGFDLAACRCAAGQSWRRPHVIRAWCVKHGVQPRQVARLEEFMDEDGGSA